MKMTFKKDLNMKSLVLRHNILLEASNLIMGREGVLQTEKDLFLVLAFMDNLIEEDLIQEVNEDGRDLTAIMLEDIEPEFLKLIEQEEYQNLYKEIEKLHLQRCKEIWDNQHSAFGIIDALLTTIAALSPEETKEVLKATGTIAEKAYEHRTEVMENKAEETNSKLEALIEQYRRKENGMNQEVQEKEGKEENDAK